MAQFTSYKEENITYWTHRAPGYSAVNQAELATDQQAVWTETLEEQIAAHFPGKEPQELRLLDVGTGPGFFAIIMARRGYQVTAVDYTAAMLDQARRNAGALAERITFLRMDAQELTFPDGAFDVVVSRNVTWNLQDPASAYGHWVRVLRPGGLLLNFDANWYRYLFDDQARSAHQTDRENVARSDVGDENAGTDVDAMEAIARQTPLAARTRPAWDLERLRELHMTATAEPDIWRQVWTREELTNNASTPMFLVRAVKWSPERAG